MTFSIIISVYNEENTLGDCLRHVQQLQDHVEIIVVDGGSHDRSYQIARSFGVQAYCSERGRGIQMQTGAEKATGDIFIFLHADTQLPQDTFRQVKEVFEDQAVQIATFRMIFDVRHWILRLYAFFSRYDSLLTSFGDQGIVVRKEFYDSLGGFPNWPIFEDVHFLRLARRKTRIHSLRGPVVTSARAYLKRGFIKQQLFNGYLIIRYLLGASPWKLYAKYYQQQPVGHQPGRPS